jgi:hypothetical protein
MMNSRYIGLDLSQIQQDGIRSDTIIVIDDVKNQYPQIIIEAHFIVLWAASDFFKKSLSKPLHNQNTTCASAMAVDQQNNKLVIPCQLDFNYMGGFDEIMVRRFFGLFYTPTFTEEKLGPEIMNYIAENILHLYQLANIFIFTSLTAYCETLLFSSFSLDHFKLLTEYAVSPSPNGRTMSIGPDRMNLYRRYLQWYQCCVDQPTYTKLPGGSDGGGGGGGGGDIGMDVEGPGYINREYFSCKKDDIMREYKNVIDNIDLCQIPSRRVKTIGATNRSIDYYRKLCCKCIKTYTSVNGIHYVDLGSITKISSNQTEVYSFRLKKEESKIHHSLEIAIEARNTGSMTTQFPKRMRLNSNSMVIDDQTNGTTTGYASTSSSLSSEEGDENKTTTTTNKDSEHKYYSCKTSITLLSQQLDLRNYDYLHERKLLGFVSEEIGLFELHDEKFCYTGRCDKCKEKDTSIYIIIMKILLERLKLFHEPVLSTPPHPD